MNQRQLASVLLAVLGLFLAVPRIPELIMGATLLLQSGLVRPDDAAAEQFRSVAWLGASLLTCLIGVGLVLLRGRIADRLFADAPRAVTSVDIQAAAFAVLGAYFAIEGAARMLRPEQFHAYWAIQIAMGIGLFLGARGLSRVWSLARTTHTSAG